MDKKFLISGGGTVDIYTSTAIADEIKERFSNSKILFTGSSSRMKMKKIPENGYKITGYGYLVLIEKTFFKFIISIKSYC